MLTALHLRDFVIVDILELHFDSGFTVLSGETGAGKSILIDALSLALGARADSQVVREGAARTDITAEFRIGPELATWLADRNLEGDPEHLLLRRIIDVEGRSRALVNQHPTTLAMVRELAAFLVDVHGQHASQALLHSDGQRKLLDRIAQLYEPLQDLATCFNTWRHLERTLEAAQRTGHETARERERLDVQIEQLRALNPSTGEWEVLHQEQKRLAHAATLIEGARFLVDALLEADDALTQRLHSMQQRLRAMQALDPELTATLDVLEGATIQIAEVASRLNSYSDRIDLDPQRLSELEQRLGALFAAGRKFRLPPDQLADTLRALEQQHAALPLAEDLERLATQAAQAKKHYTERAAVLTDARTRAAAALEQRASQSISALGMPGARFEIKIEAGEPTAHGVDRVVFQIAGHTGVAARPLSKVASGGELSRISLAISALAAQANPVATLIFDEADAGVGGAVAEVIGALMRNLGQSRQVLCVTHLPQVASQAHHHFLVTKTQTAGQTLSHIQALDLENRVGEIARMLGGRSITATTRQHAREMLGRSQDSLKS